MAKEKFTKLTLQIDTEQFHAAEKIYKKKGYSFEEAIQLLLLQSIEMRELPFLFSHSVHDQIKHNKTVFRES